jgi:hypothetical protein
MQPSGLPTASDEGDAYNLVCKQYNLSNVSEPLNVELCALVQHLTTIL